MAECVRERPKQKKKKKQISKSSATKNKEKVESIKSEEVIAEESSILEHDKSVDESKITEKTNEQIEDSITNKDSDTNLNDNIEVIHGLSTDSERNEILEFDKEKDDVHIEGSIVIPESPAVDETITNKDSDTNLNDNIEVIHSLSTDSERNEVLEFDKEKSDVHIEGSIVIPESPVVDETISDHPESSSIATDCEESKLEPSAPTPSIKAENQGDKSIIEDNHNHENNVEYPEVSQSGSNYETIQLEPSAPPPSIETENVKNEEITAANDNQEEITPQISQSARPRLMGVSRIKQSSTTSYQENVKIKSTRTKENTNQSIISAYENTTLVQPMSTPSNLLVQQNNVIPFTEEQLNHFYYNAELEHIDYFVDEFLKNANKEQHEFYELVLFYYKSRKRLAEFQDKIQTFQTQVRKDQKVVWKFKDCTVIGEGTCGCGVKVQQQQKYQQAFFERDVSLKMANNLFQIRGIAHETLPLELYNSQVSRIRIENYLTKLFKSSTLLTELNSSVPMSVLLPTNISNDTLPILCKLQDCISALFVFKRYGVLEESFSKDVDYWLSLLVAALHRIGTLPDSFFLMNHLLRCPPSTIPNVSQFLQFPKFQHLNLSMMKWNSPLIHHFVVMLATLTLPVRSRKKFLSKFKMNIKNPNLNRGISWTLVDEDQEEVENQEDSWSLLMESDLISIFEQFSFTKLLIFLLEITTENEGELNYCPSKSSSNDMMCLFALSSCIIKLLGKIFDTYALLRYRQFLKCISRTIRLIIQVVSDHWVAYRHHRLYYIGDKSNSFPAYASSSVPQFSVDKLQVEFDQMFLKASKRILSSRSPGAIQFLSTMPFEALQLKSMWVMMCMILDQEKDLDFLLKTSGPDSIPSVKFMDASPSEGIFLLTALSNMAIARTDPMDRKLIETIATQILEIAFLNSSLLNLYSRNGRDFLATISSKHPYVMSALLDQVDVQKNDLQQVLLFIFEVLPFEVWEPTVYDLERLRGWLVDCSIYSEESKLSRMILSRLNYDKKKDENKLFLPRVFHFAIAIMIVECFGISFPDFPGGIQKLDNTNIGIIGQASKIVASSYTKITQSKFHSDVLSWAWDVMLRLKLHESDVLEYGDGELTQISGLENVTECWTKQVVVELSKKRACDIDLDGATKLVNVNLAVKSNGLLARYVTFALTKDGHFVDLFLKNGLEHMTVLNDWYQYEAVLKILHNITRLFLNCAEKLNNQNFLQVLNKLIHVDVDKAGYTEKIWQYFIAGTYSQKIASLVASQVLKAQKRSVEKAHSVIYYWMFLFSKIPDWTRDCGVLFQIDSLCKVASTVQDGLSVIEGILYERYKLMIKAQEPRGLLSSMVSWISSNQHISLLSSVSGDFCFYAYIAIRIEKKYEEAIGLWKELSMEMLNNPKMTVEEAYKKKVTTIKSSYIPSLQQLSIYRFGEQVMVTPPDHPFLPMLWREFFIMFFKKSSKESGLPSRIGIGERLFKSFSMASTLKQMNSTLRHAASYHQQKSVPQSSAASSEKEHHYPCEFNGKLACLYQGLSLWLEESRLHDPNLYIDSLPDMYIPELLLKVFQGEQDAWLEYWNKETVVGELEVLSNLWSNVITKTIVRSDVVEGASGELSNVNRIIKRLTSESSPRPPPDVVQPQTPVNEPTLHVILTQPRLIQTINHDLQRIVQYAKASSVQSALHVGLDTEYLEMLPDLYEMVNRTVYMHIPCEGKKRRDGCKSPAHVSVRFEELRLRDRVSRLLDDNRAEFDKLIKKSREMFPEDLCVSTVNVENIISKLSEAFRTLGESQKQNLQQSASQLFYLLAELIDDDVKRCYPAIQFFSSGVESIGKVYIADTPSEQLHLLDTILTHHSSVMFLAPHFYPMIALDQFTELYSKVVSHMCESNLTTIFVLLSKFDVSTWMQTKPVKTQVTKFLSVVVQSIGNLGFEPSTEGLVVLEQFRNHLDTIFSRDINNYFATVLTELLTASSKKSITTLCWSDFLNILHFNHKEGELPSPEECVLSIDQIKEVLQYMAVYFPNMCEGMNQELENVYSSWEPYISPLNTLLTTLLYFSVTHSMRTNPNPSRDSVLRESWEHILSLYKPWIIPQSSGKVWTLLRSESVMQMIRGFVIVIRHLIDTHVEQQHGYCIILNEVWGFYARSILPAVREEQSLELFNVLLLQLPWSHFFPSIDELRSAMEVYSTHPYAFGFYGELLLNVDWPIVVSSYMGSGQENNICQFHHYLLNIILMLATSKVIWEKSETRLIDLLQTAKTFHWSVLQLADITASCHWYWEIADSSLIFSKDSIVWKVLSLLEIVTGNFVSDQEQQTTQAQSLSDTAVSKRSVYFMTLSSIFIRCSSLQSLPKESLELVIEQFLTAIEKTVTYNIANPMEELVKHSSTFLATLNHFTTGVIPTTMKASIDAHLLSTSCGMIVLAFISAASRSIAQLKDMIMILEHCIQTHFVRLSDSELQGSWVPVLQSFVSPELSKEDFVKEAISQNAILTLYTFNLHRISKVTSQQQQLHILIDCVQWCSKPQLEGDDEAKLLLLWLQIFDIVRSQLAQPSKDVLRTVAKHMMFLCSSCQVQGEDKNYSGIFGIIGIGKRSTLSKEFRFTAKAVHLFLTCQLPSSLIPIRHQPDSPGAIRNLQLSNTRPTNDAEKSFASFQNLVKNKTYNSMKEQIDWVVKFVSNPKICILDGCTLVAYLAKESFMKHNFIAASLVG